MNDGVQREEAVLFEGVCDIVHRMTGWYGHDPNLAEICHWFVRRVRNSLFESLVASQRRDDPPILPLPAACVRSALYDNSATAAFYGVAKVEHLTVFRKNRLETAVSMSTPA